MVTRHKLQGLKWELLRHQPFIPDLTPIDDHLFLSMAHDWAREGMVKIEYINALLIGRGIERDS